LIVHLASVAQLGDWAINISDAAYQLAEAFWPGPLALVLDKHPDVPLAVTGGQDTVALRIPNHPVALHLLQAFGGGVAAPSANRFCRISPTQATHVAEEMGDAVALILDGGACQVGVESTIINLSGAAPRLLRPGQITWQQVSALLNTELLLPETTPQPNNIKVPGMHIVHYAPLTQAIRCETGQLTELLSRLHAEHTTVGLLSCGNPLSSKIAEHCVDLPNVADGYAQGLYAALRHLDHQGLKLLVVEQPPQTEAWRAVNDRLAKATAPYNQA
jgi:L-threonylcarbamoyladenylate synthase